MAVFHNKLSRMDCLFKLYVCITLIKIKSKIKGKYNTSYWLRFTAERNKHIAPGLGCQTWMDSDIFSSL